MIKLLECTEQFARWYGYFKWNWDTAIYKHDPSALYLVKI